MPEGVAPAKTPGGTFVAQDAEMAAGAAGMGGPSTLARISLEKPKVNAGACRFLPCHAATLVSRRHRRRLDRRIAGNRGRRLGNEPDGELSPRSRPADHEAESWD